MVLVVLIPQWHNYLFIYFLGNTHLLWMAAYTLRNSEHMRQKNIMRFWTYTLKQIHKPIFFYHSKYNDTESTWDHVNIFVTVTVG